MDGKQLDSMIRDTFNLGSNDPITPKQLNYVMGLMVPSNYLLQNHTIDGKPVTYNVPNRNEDMARGHRPWQVSILNDLSKDVIVIKGRQMGLNLAPL